jgi:ATP-dependent protease ClpP protease subunit
MDEDEPVLAGNIHGSGCAGRVGALPKEAAANRAKAGPAGQDFPARPTGFRKRLTGFFALVLGMAGGILPESGESMPGRPLMPKTNSQRFSLPPPPIRLHGPLTKQAATRLVAKIRPLLKRRAFPLVISINCGGGELEAFYRLGQLLASVPADAADPKIITFAQRAHSAAACLLVIGHRAYARKNAHLHFHGVRYPRLKKIQAFNREKALNLAMRLDRENRRLAWMLAEPVVGRIVEQSGLRRAEAAPRAAPAEFLQNHLAQVGRHLTSTASRQLLEVTLARWRLIFAVARLLPLRRPPKDRADRAALDAAVCKAALDFATRDAQWASRAGTAPGLAALMMDFLLLHNLAHNHHPAVVHDLAKTFRGDFFAEPERLVYERMRLENPSAARVFLLQSAKPYLRVLWYFAFALCHELLAGEHTLPAADACVLGLIDGVRDHGPPWNSP